MLRRNQFFRISYRRETASLPSSHNAKLYDARLGTVEDVTDEFVEDEDEERVDVEAGELETLAASFLRTITSLSVEDAQSSCEMEDEGKGSI
jgi:hypothetical protein